jgi:hypothetical protein
VVLHTGYYHLHETGESQSLARFKERLGAVSVEYCDYRIELRPQPSMSVAAVRRDAKPTPGGATPAPTPAV